MTIRSTADVTVTADPEVRFSAAGKAWTSIRCVSKERRNVNGQWVDSDPTWLSVVAYGKVAEMIAESGVAKGSRLLVTGKLHNREYQTRDGEKRQSLEIVADNVALDMAFTAYERIASAQASRGGGQRREQAGEQYQPWEDSGPVDSAPFLGNHHRGGAFAPPPTGTRKDIG